MLKDAEGIDYWKPTIKQERFLQIPLTVKEGFYAGALMAGKSDVLLMYPIVFGWHKHPEFKGVFLRRTMPELENEIIPRAKEYYRHFGAKFNGSTHFFTFPSGALIKMGHCEYEKDVHDYDSMQINYLGIDELSSFTEYIYLYLTIERVRTPKHLSGILPEIVRCASNPGNIGHQFVYKRFIKPYPNGGKILIGRGGVRRVFIPATIDDNPHASEQYKRELDALPEAERKAKKFGDWTAYEGQVFDEFRDKRFPDEPENAIHVVDEFDIPYWWPKICAIDWGFAAMCSIGWAAISPSKKIYIYRHQYFYGKKIEEWAPEVAHYVNKDNPVDIVICHSANQHRGDPHTILEQVSEALGQSVRLGERDRVGGKQLLHEYLRWKPKPVIPLAEMEKYDGEIAAWILRNKGLDEYKTYIAHFNPKEEIEDIPRLLLFKNDDVALIGEAIKACVYEKSDRDGKKKEDVAEFNGDDPYDMLRMLLHAADSFFSVAIDEQDKLSKTAKIVEQLQNSGNMTGFYMQMRKVDEEEGLEKPVKMFHGSSKRH